jgi:TolA-binding protein
MADDEAEERIGSLVDGRYKILETMAAGSMGAVYKAERVPVGKIVAIKFLHASYKNDSEFQARFDRETRVMSKLAHPNCVTVLDFGVWNNMPYLVMEYVDGTTLRTRMDQGPMTVSEALSFARQIASGLAHAHEQGIIHRDIKPANMMITADIGSGERIRILDFGLARLRGNVGRDATQTNLVVGTPNYMAPEQTVPGANIDARCDIYAVGVVLYEMIVGERPFTSEDTLQLLGMHRAAPIPRMAEHVRPGTEIPDGLQELVDTAMAKSPSERFQTAIELADALDEITGARSIRPGEASGLSVPVRQRNSGSAPVARTGAAPVVRARTENARSERNVAPKKGRPFLGLLIVFGGAAAMAAYLIHRSGQQSVASGKVLDGSGSAIATGSGKTGSNTPDLGSGAMAALDAGTPMLVAPADAATEADAAQTPDAELMYFESDDAGLPIIPTDAFGQDLGSAATGSGSGTGPGSEGVDPTTAEDPNPQKNSGSNTDEDDNAPKTPEQIEAMQPKAVQLASSVQEAIALIKDGKRDTALASLRALWKKQPNSSYIPFLLGNLYFDQRWWSVAMDHYAIAIKQAPDYRGNATLNKNVIQMLGSTKTRTRATNFLRSTIGRSARPYLSSAAKYADNAVIRKQAGIVLRGIR